MKKALNLSLALAIFLSLAFPAQGAFLSSKQASSKNQASDNSISVTKTIPVVTAKPDQIVIAATPAGGKNILASSCQISAQATGVLLQGSFAVNLNQPASCFSLTPAHLAVSAAPLAVLPLAQAQPKVVVLVTPPMFSSPDFSTTPASPFVPVLPLAVYGFAILAFSKRRSLKQSFLKLTNNSQGELPLTLHQLMMLRC